MNKLLIYRCLRNCGTIKKSCTKSLGSYGTKCTLKWLIKLLICRESRAKIPVCQQIRQSIPLLIYIVQQSNCRWHYEPKFFLGWALKKSIFTLSPSPIIPSLIIHLQTLRLGSLVNLIIKIIKTNFMWKKTCSTRESHLCVFRERPPCAPSPENNIHKSIAFK